MWDSIDEKGLQAIIEALPSYAPKDGIFDVPDGLLGMIDRETERLLINERTINYIKDGDTSSLLRELVESDDLSELKDDMVNYYNVAYNDAAHSELFDGAMSELEGLFGAKPKWVTVTGPDENTVRNMVEIPIIQSMYDDLYEQWLNNFSDFPEHSYSEYIDSWAEVLDEKGDKLKFPYLDHYYPDHNMVNDYFNDALRDNLYGRN